jgi:nucleoside-diphosphate-sugar epimerase
MEECVSASGAPLVLVTGATGFVGTPLCAGLAAAGYRVRRALRASQAAAPDDSIVGDIGPDTDWREALAGVDAVVHLAARTHVLHDTADDPLAAYRRINVEGTQRLATAALRAGVRHFVFMSSIKVNGEATRDAPFRAADPPRPEDAYGNTKREAEEVLRTLAAPGGLQLTILRPPLVYGPGVKGNFLRLMKLVARGVPLPLGSIENRRSLVYVGNLNDLVLACLRSPHAAGQTFLVSDGVDLSTPELVRALATALGVRPRLVPFPPRLLELVAAVLRRSDELKRLTGSLEVDANPNLERLGWRPPHTPAQGLAATAEWYHAQLRACATRP